jgi:hypothetical protein
MTFATSEIMKKYRTEIAAREWAQDQGLFYGCAKIGGMWCVGTQRELTKICVWRILR